MSLEISGKIVQKLNLQEGNSARGPWKKQEAVLETFDQYPKKVCISFWGDKVDDLDKYQAGASIKCAINIESREYNGKWYTDVRAWKVDPYQTGGSSDASSTPQDIQTFDDMNSQGFDSGDVDDLPF